MAGGGAVTAAAAAAAARGLSASFLSEQISYDQTDDGQQCQADKDRRQIFNEERDHKSVSFPIQALARTEATGTGSILTLYERSSRYRNTAAMKIPAADPSPKPFPAIRLPSWYTQRETA
jgi:hypothetical protein